MFLDSKKVKHKVLIWQNCFSQFTLSNIQERTVSLLHTINTNSYASSSFVSTVDPLEIKTYSFQMGAAESSSSSNVGLIVGLVVGIVGGIILLLIIGAVIAGVIYFYKRRRHDYTEI